MMRSICCVLISLACLHNARAIKPKKTRGLFAFVSWIFLAISVVFMILGI